MMALPGYPCCARRIGSRHTGHTDTTLTKRFYFRSPDQGGPISRFFAPSVAPGCSQWTCLQAVGNYRELLDGIGSCAVLMQRRKETRGPWRASSSGVDTGRAQTRVRTDTVAGPVAQRTTPPQLCRPGTVLSLGTVSTALPSADVPGPEPPLPSAWLVRRVADPTGRPLAALTSPRLPAPAQSRAAADEPKVKKRCGGASRRCIHHFALPSPNGYCGGVCVEKWRLLDSARQRIPPLAWEGGK